MAPSKIEEQSATASPMPIVAHKFPSEANSEAYARQQDAQEPLRAFRDQFIIPSKSDLKIKSLPNQQTQESSDADPSTYFCGNSLGLQPKRTAKYIESQLQTWSSVGVYGHFTNLENSPLEAWQDLAAQAAALSAPLIGAKPEEVAIMNTLSVNLHLALASFYRPEGKRNKILLEWKPFPSDHYVIESQIRWHGLDPKECMILLEPDQDHIISTEKVLRTIEEQVDEIAVVMLPGVQYYTGQLFEMEKITKFAKDRGLVVGWDLAHAVGNVPMELSKWDVDFAAWCTYKYLCAGPGSIAGMYLNEKHGKVEFGKDGEPIFRHRLMGWYGGDKESRFKMDNKFRPIVGAGGFQLSNPSAIDLTSLIASLSIFNETSVQALREKSLRVTAYLQYLLLENTSSSDEDRLFRIITPLDPAQRGAQLSVLLKPGLLKNVASTLKSAGIVADQREPDVVRVAPVPLYNSYYDVWYFVSEFKKAIGI